MYFSNFINALECKDCIVKACCSQLCDKNIDIFKEYIIAFLTFKESRTIEYDSKYDTNKYRITEDCYDLYKIIESKSTKCVAVLRDGSHFEIDYNLYDKLGWQEYLDDNNQLYDSHFTLTKWKRNIKVMTF